MKLGYALLLSFVVSFTAQAATFYQFNLGVNYWDKKHSALAGEVADAQLPVQNESSSQELVLGFEHPIPLVPNFKLATSDYQATGQQLLTQTFILSEQTFKVATTLDIDFDYDYTDYTFYYEMFDNQVFEVDLGVTFKSIDAILSVNNVANQSENSNRKASGIEGYFHTAGKFNLPLLNLSFGTQLNAKDSDNFDVEFSVLYELDWVPVINPHLQLGWKKQELQLDDFDSLYLSHSWESVFAGVLITF